MLALAGFAVSAPAQARHRASGAAALLKEPGGIRLGSLVAGVSYPTGRTNGAHVEATVDGKTYCRTVSGTSGRKEIIVHTLRMK